MTISKVKSVQGNGTWDSKYGTLYQFVYEMEDGTTLQANHKSQDGAFAVGTEVEYEITRTHETHGNSGKVKKPESSFTPRQDNTVGIEVGHALNNGVQIAIAKHGDKMELQHVKSYARKILALAAQMKAEVNNAKTAGNETVAIQQPVQSTAVEPPAAIESNDLPF